MEHRVEQSKGFSLIEVLVAMVLLVVVFLGLLAGILTSYKISVNNEIRNQAVKITQEMLENYRAKPFSSILDINISCNNPSAETVIRKIRNQNVVFKIGKKITTHPDPTGNNLDIKEIKIETCWEYRGKKHKVLLSTLVKKEKS